MMDYYEVIRILDSFASLGRAPGPSNIECHYQINNSRFRIIVFNKGSMYKAYMYRISPNLYEQHRIRDVWEELPNDFKYDASFHLDIFN